MKRFRKYLSGEYEENKVNKNIKNGINASDKNLFKDEVQNKFETKLKVYIKSQNFINILNKFIQNVDDIDLIYEKLINSKIKKNNNKNLEFDYYCDLIFIIKNLLIQIIKKMK